MDSQINNVDFYGIFSRHCFCSYLITLFRISEILGGLWKIPLKGRNGLAAFTYTLLWRTQAPEKVTLCVAHWPGSHSGPKRGSVAPESFPIEETFAFCLSLHLSYLSAPLLSNLLSANLFCFSFVSMQFISSVYFSISVAFPTLPFLLLFSTRFHSLTIALNVIVFLLLHVFSSIHHSLGWISQSPFYLLGSLWITPGIFRVKNTKALTGKVFVQGHRKLVPMGTLSPHGDHVTDWSHTPPQM